MIEYGAGNDNQVWRPAGRSGSEASLLPVQKECAQMPSRFQRRGKIDERLGLIERIILDEENSHLTILPGKLLIGCIDMPEVRFPRVALIESRRYADGI